MNISEGKKSRRNSKSMYYTEIPLYNIDNENSSDLWMKYEEILSSKSWDETKQECDNLEDKIDILYSNIESAMAQTFDKKKVK